MMSAWKLTLACLCVGLFTIGIWDVLFNFQQNRCQMTYMFENPEYELIKLGQHVRHEFPAYNLFIYGEGARAAQYRRKLFTGIPVLFIPGNAGSYKQGRSLGSVLLRMAEKRPTGPQFDVFTVDLNEEFAGLYGGSLLQQTKFLLHCMQKIAALYPAIGNSKIVLVGHSVGGIIARGLFLNPNFDTAMVDTIFTLSTPHRPVVLADAEFQEYYENVNSYWTSSINTTLRNVLLVSFGGGHRDVLVRSELTSLVPLFGKNQRTISVTTTSIPSVWASTDHLCVVWCKQLVISTSKALFEMVDYEKKRISDDVHRRVAAVEKYFLNPESTAELTLTATKKLRPMPIHAGVTSRLEVHKSRTDGGFYQRFALNGLPEGDIFIRSTQWKKNWIHICFSSTCNEAVPLNISVSRIPSFSDHSHFIAVISKDILNMDYADSLLFELNDNDALELYVESTPLLGDFSSSTGFAGAILGVQFSVSNSSYFRRTISLEQIWEAIKLTVTTDQCNGNEARGTIRFTVPGLVQDTYQLIDRAEVAFPLKLQTAGLSEKRPLLELILNPSCNYNVQFTVAWTDVMGQIIRFYLLQLPAFFAAVIVVKMLPLYRKLGESFWDHLIVNVIAAVGIALDRLVMNSEDRTVVFEGASIVSSVGLWIFFYCTALCAVATLEFFIKLLVTFYSWPVHAIISPVVSKLQAIREKFPLFWERLSVFPMFAVVTSAIGYWSCGENGIMLAVIVYFIKTCYHKRNETMKLGPSLDIESNSKLLLLALLSTMVNVIPALVWTRHLPTGLSGVILMWQATHGRLDPDPSLVMSVLVGVALDLSNFKRVKQIRACFSVIMDRIMMVLIYATGALVLLFAQHVFYLINFFLCLLLATMSCDFIRKLVLGSEEPINTS